MPNHLHSQKRLTARFVLGALLAAFSLLALTPILLYLIWSNGQARRVSVLVARIKSAGEPVTVADLDGSFPFQKGEEDVTKFWVAGIDSLVHPQGREEMAMIPFVGSATWEAVPRQGTEFTEFAYAEKLLAQNQVALENFHEAARRGGHGRFPVNFSQGFSTLLPYTQNLRGAARILRLEFEIKARKGDTAGAAEALNALLVTSRGVEKEPTLVSQLVAIAIDGVAASALAEKLCHTPFSDSDLLEFQKRLRSKVPQQRLRTAFLGERALGHSVMKDPSLMGSDRPPISPMQSDIACHLEYMERFLSANELETPQALAKMDQIEKELQADMASTSKRLTMIYTSLMLPAMGAATHASARLHTQIHAADAGIAVELYRREHKTLPKSLAELTPKYLPTVPLDPYTGKPLLFKTTAEGFTIYGVGKDKVDNGGTLDSQQTDIGLFFPLK